MKLSGNTILITGGSSGIGMALAKRFVALQNTVIVTGRDKQKLERMKETIPGIHAVPGDLADDDTVTTLTKYVTSNFATINVLINNAAVQYNYTLGSDREVLQNIDYEIATNLSAPIKLTALLLPALQKNHESAIVNVSSGLFIAPKKSASVYCATKAAVHSFTKTLRYQLEDSGIKVFEMIPPLVDTPMTEGRGKSKITSDRLVDEFITDFKHNRYESFIGKTKLLRFVHRMSPALADNIMKNGL